MAGALIPALALVIVAALAGCASGGRVRHPSPPPRAARAAALGPALLSGATLGGC